MNTTIKLDFEMIEKLGGIISDDGKYAVFYFKDCEPVSDENGEEIIGEAKKIEYLMIDAGYEGALLGSPNNSMNNAIYFDLRYKESEK